MSIADDTLSSHGELKSENQFTKQLKQTPTTQLGPVRGMRLEIGGVALSISVQKCESCKEQRKQEST